MACRKILLSGLMLFALVLTGCGRGARKDVAQKAQDDMVCLKRADLKLIAAALNRKTATMEAAIKSGADVNVTVEGLGHQLSLRHWATTIAAFSYYWIEGPTSTQKIVKDIQR